MMVTMLMMISYYNNLTDSPYWPQLQQCATSITKKPFFS